MKTVTVPMLLTLALCLIQDAASEDANQETCSEFQALMKNGKLFCSQDKKLLQSPGEKIPINKCVTCKMILEKEAKSQKRAGSLAKDTKATAPSELNCNDFRKGEKDGDFICTADEAAVCGTDGKTYRNRCELCAENQKTSSQVGIRSEGKCESSNPEQDVCSAFRAYVKDGRLGCTRENDPVLGPDGRTHGNKCAMCAELFLREAAENAKREGENRIRRNAEEDLCKEFENQVRNGRLFCTRESDPIRGPDGRMHGNKCSLCAEIFLRNFSEEKNKSDQNLHETEDKIKVKREIEKQCSEYQDHAEKGILFCTRENDPVRGPDGKMHGNLCSMCQAFFQKEAEEKKKAEARARIKRRPRKASEYAMLCSKYRPYINKGKLICSKEIDTIRGPDGKTYGNACSMCHAYFKAEEKKRKTRESNSRNKRQASTDSFEKLCSEYRKSWKNGQLICTRENDPIQGPDGKMHGNTCSMCQAYFKTEEEKKMKESNSRNKRQATSTDSFEKLCSEYRKSWKNGQLICTRENDPIQGPDGKMHGNTCSMCEAYFKQEERARAKAKREAAKESCSEFRDQVKDGVLMCTREHDPVLGPDDKMHGNKCSMCASLFQLEEEEKKNNKEEEEKLEAEKVKREAVEKLCSEYRHFVKDGRLPCTRENDPIEGLDGKVHGNTCSMCEAFFLQEAKEKEAETKKVRRGFEKDSCSEFRSLLQDGNLFCTRENDPVRGPDGKTHGNKCAMCKAVFQKENEERKKKEEDDQRNSAGHGSNGGGGKAQDPCAEYRELMKNGRLSCTRESDPVRGADGKSYNNKCAMCKELLQKEMEEKDKNSGFRSNGTGSGSGKDVCDEFRSQMKNGQLICTRESDPVRGPDGKTHGNKCAMCKEKLEREAAEKKKKEDEEKKNTGEKSNDKEDVCHEFRNKQRDGRLVCTRDHNPVRGPDGKMHVNKCAMCLSIFEREASERKKNDEEKSSSKPSNNAKDECSDFRKQMINGELICTKEHDLVSDGDGKFYRNKCHKCRAVFQKEALERSKLRRKSSHSRDSEGKSNSDSSVSFLDSNMCKRYRVLPKLGYICPKNFYPVCGDDGQTYDNPCVLCHINLKQQTNIHIRSIGRCQQKSPETQADADVSNE